MREIIFDTETTGLDCRLDRVIEIGAVELVNRFPTGRVFHEYIFPEGRAIDAEALAVHGITMESLHGKPRFAQVADGFLEFIDGARLVAHNAGFDMGFINAELERLGHPAVDPLRVVDTLALAKRRHPMGPNSLDALCRRYGIDNSMRTSHNALLDVQLLAQVYLELMGGKQPGFELASARMAKSTGPVLLEAEPVHRTPRPIIPTEAELATHAAFVAKLKEPIWATVEG